MALSSGEVVCAREPAKHADGRLERVDVLVLVIRETAVQPLASLGQGLGQVHDHHGVEAVDDDPPQAVGAHLRALARDGMIPVFA